MSIVGFVEMYPFRARIYNMASLGIARFFDRILICSEALRQVTHQYRIPQDKVRLLYNFVDLAKREVGQGVREEVRAEFGFGADDQIILNVARLDAEKGQHYLIRAVPAIARKFPRARFLLVGDGRLRSALEQTSRQLGLEDRVVFAGYRSDSARIMAAADLIAMPSLREGLSVAMLEAMAFAKPIVATAVDGTAEAVKHQETGILVPPKDAEALAEGICSVLGDADKAHRLGQEGRRLVESQFSLETSTKTLSGYYQELLDGRKGVLS
jgi:glycosyltransferase involved in cell wall biosynthesis